MNATNRVVIYIDMKFVFILNYVQVLHAFILKLCQVSAKKQRFVFLRFTCPIKSWMAASV